MMIQKALHRIRPHDCLQPEFLYYYFLHKGRVGHLSPLFTGSTIKHLPREKLALVEVPVPPRPTQNKIASILSAYDDLIENNRRRIALLEAGSGSYSTENGSSASTSPVTNTQKSSTACRKGGRGKRLRA